jgi:phosphate/sulfate permease
LRWISKKERVSVSVSSACLVLKHQHADLPVPTAAVVLAAVLAVMLAVVLAANLLHPTVQ